MKHKHRKNKNLLLKLLFVLALIVVAVVLAVQMIDFDKIFSPKEEPAPQEVQTSTHEPTPTPTIEQDVNNNGDPVPDEPEPEPVKQEVPQYDGQNPNVNDQLTGVITYAGVSGNNIIVRVNIDQYLNGGACNLVLSQNGKAVYGISAAIVDSASTATCQGFNIPLSEVPSGEYQIMINLTSERKSGTIEGKINI